MKTIHEIYEQLQNWSFEDYCYYVASGDLEFLAGSGAEMTKFKLDWLDKQGFRLVRVHLGCTHKVVFSFEAKRDRFRIEKQEAHR